MEPSDIYDDITDALYDAGRTFLRERTPDEIRAFIAYASHDADSWLREMARDELAHRES